MKKRITLLLAAALLLTASCAVSPAKESTPPSNSAVSSQVTASEEGQPPTVDTYPSDYLQPYSNVRPWEEMIAGERTAVIEKYASEDIITFCFNADTVFPGDEELAAQIIENGKNPGLGVRALHDQGITGEGVKVAIIDQSLAQPFHPEFGGRIISYTDFLADQMGGRGSTHGPAVASLLVGQSCGVAPDAELYFAATGGGTSDSAYYAEALRWIIEQNNALPEGDKIRVVSVSAAPSGSGTLFTSHLEEWDDAVAEAQAAGLLILDCRYGYETGIVAPGYYDPVAPDDVTRFKTGFPSSSFERFLEGIIFAPASYRTTAEAYSAAHNSWLYSGQGGSSWAIPYIAGVLALGWQADPALTNEEIVRLLFDTAWADANGNKVVNPQAFITEIQSH